MVTKTEWETLTVIWPKYIIYVQLDCPILFGQLLQGRPTTVLFTETQTAPYNLKIYQFQMFDDEGHLLVIQKYKMPSRCCNVWHAEASLL